MKARLLLAFLALACASLPAQAPTPAASPTPAPAPTRAFTSDVGFTYLFPGDWDVVDMTAALKDQQQQAQEAATSDAAKRGVACTQIAMSARHGSPTSTVVAVVLPFACLGSEMTVKDLAGMGTGAVEGIQPNFDLTEPVVGAYSLGSHSMWIERIKGTLKDHPEAHYTIETVCGLLKKGAVCWMELAADDQALATFEHGLITLDSEPPTALVPASAFAQKPE